MSELSQRASDRRDAEHIRDDGYRTDEERRLAGRYIALDDVLIAAEAKIERRNATYTKPSEGCLLSLWRAIPDLRKRKGALRREVRCAAHLLRNAEPDDSGYLALE